MNKGFVLIGAAFTLLLSTGCAKDVVHSSYEVEEKKPVVQLVEVETMSLYEKLNEMQGWSIEKEISANPPTISIIHEKQNVKGVFSVIETDKAIISIQEELLRSAGNVIVIEQTKNHLAYQTDRKDSVRTDIFTEQVDGKTTIFTLITPLHEYEQNQGIIMEFK
ncbi:hypothetical protein [Bacillus sp. FJAT-45350]|uniref:hypothetical protein n=1 Tax=Bacillus sp. FJAT-45350 TaxID=2011014 RepID=UPI000BB860B6|nr:hypothetical protein [Bacillus sp. FJAT-45350]